MSDPVLEGPAPEIAMHNNPSPKADKTPEASPDAPFTRFIELDGRSPVPSQFRTAGTFTSGQAHCHIHSSPVSLQCHRFRLTAEVLGRLCLRWEPIFSSGTACSRKPHVVQGEVWRRGRGDERRNFFMRTCMAESGFRTLHANADGLKRNGESK